MPSSTARLGPSRKSIALARPLSLVALILAASAIAPAAFSQDAGVSQRWEFGDYYKFHKVVGQWDISAQKGALDESDVTLTDAQGRKRQLDQTLPGSIRDVVAFEALRLVFILNDGNELAVVDPSAAKVVDEFYAMHITFSPTHRFIAFTAIVPRWAEASELYLVYDLALSPERNCMATDCSPLSHGIAVYPDENRRDRSYDVTLYDATDDDAARPADKVIAAMHELKSELTWIDESRFAFLDCSRNACQVVTADVRGGGAKAEVVAHALNVRALVDVKRVPTQMPIYPAQWIWAEWIGRQDVGGKTGIRVWLKRDAWMKAEYVDVGLSLPGR